MDKKTYRNGVHLHPSQVALEYEGDLFWCTDRKCVFVPKSGITDRHYVLFPEDGVVFVVAPDRVLSRRDQKGIRERDLQRIHDVAMKEIAKAEAGGGDYELRAVNGKQRFDLNLGKAADLMEGPEMWVRLYEFGPTKTDDATISIEIACKQGHPPSPIE